MGGQHGAGLLQVKQRDRACEDCYRLTRYWRRMIRSIDGAASAETTADFKKNLRIRMKKAGRATFIILLLNTIPTLAQSGHVFELSNGKVVEATSTERILSAEKTPRRGSNTSRREQDIYFISCDDVRGAGYSPMRIGTPGYREGLDGGHDGITCEPYLGR